MIRKSQLGNVSVTSMCFNAADRKPQEIAERFPEVPEGELLAAVEHESGHAGVAGGYRWSFNGILIDTGAARILIDTGFGFPAGGSGTSTADLLAEAGVTADEIDLVVITHAHGDHIGGLCNGEAKSFPGAQLAVSETEYRFWSSEDAEARLSPEAVSAARAAFDAYGDRLSLLSGSADLYRSGSTAVTVVPAPGHTPGHVAVDVSSADKRLRLLVDTLHTVFQIAHPEWCPRFDSDPQAAVATRRSLLDQAAEEEVTCHLYHFPFPGWGTVGKIDSPTGKRFSFTPSESLE